MSMPETAIFVNPCGHAKAREGRSDHGSRFYYI
jgi:hypothetical protein